MNEFLSLYDPQLEAMAFTAASTSFSLLVCDLISLASNSSHSFMSWSTLAKIRRCSARGGTEILTLPKILPETSLNVVPGAFLSISLATHLRNH
jgi:hypothetical protein